MVKKKKVQEMSLNWSRDMQQEGGTGPSTQFVEIIHLWFTSTATSDEDFRLFIRLDESKEGETCGNPPWRVPWTWHAPATVLALFYCVPENPGSSENCRVPRQGNVKCWQYSEGSDCAGPAKQTSMDTWHHLNPPICLLLPLLERLRNNEPFSLPIGL